MSTTSIKTFAKQSAPARKRWGQHFLHNKRVIDKIIDIACPLAKEEFLEIGPGRGALTTRLIERGIKVHAIEIDPYLCEQLSAQFSGNALLSLHHADALNFDYEQLPCAKLRLIANLPYNIGTVLLTRILALRPMLRDMHLMLQREVAMRLYAPVGNARYGRLSVLTQAVCAKVARVLQVSAGSFTPPPEVRSEVVHLVPHETLPALSTQRALEQLTRHAFGARRKQLKHSLGRLIGERALIDLGIDPTKRPQDIEPQSYLRAAHVLETRQQSV